MLRLRDLFFYWKDITLNFWKMLLFILVCGLPVWTFSLQAGGRLPQLWQKLYFSLPQSESWRIPLKVNVTVSLVIQYQVTFGLAMSIDSVMLKLLSSSCISLQNSLVWELMHILHYVINYFSLPKVSKLTIILDLPKVIKITIILGLLKFSKMTSYGGAMNTKFEKQVHLLKMIPWGTPLQM